MTKCIVSWSSGKDSAWLVHVLRAQGDIEVGALMTTINEPAQRVAMHAVRVELLEAQAAALDLPPQIDPCGERGEFHTCSYDGPMFHYPIAIETGITVDRDGFVFTDLTLATESGHLVI